MTGFAVLCSALATFPPHVRELLAEAFMHIFTLVVAIGGILLIVVTALDIVAWYKTPDPNANTLAKKIKSLLRLRYFWIGLSVSFLVAICLNFLPYYFSYHAYECDGVEVMGWPFPFFERGGLSGFVHRSLVAFLVDMLVATVLALVIGIGFRNGTRPILIQARRLLHKIRTWPNEDES
jgi:hypothetical protein